ncbi:kinase-like protein [Pilatotrama ljubarskyi]|nr:kinase-like protein [Pilatotrama ljubarskyi]
MASPLDLYEPLDIIGNGSFGIIRKVRRKADGVIFARKELNFERMTERDRKQIVAEVNILKDLHHEHIVRYHDRHVDREAGILYILMEFCGGGDLSSIIKQAQRHNRPIPEDTIWNYFMQILLALEHCHHPNGGHGRTSSVGTEGEGKERRAQILHRDLKPDNVFLDESNTVKLGDFGLSKALAYASFANTYVGTPYYMSPELMQEKAYDSKSDIWSLGCLIYELCALKPPFHEAKTHAELSILIRNGRIPPLPKGYSPALTSVIKSMLNLNPAMRPSASQLLQHERIELALKVFETQKMLNTVKGHKTALLAKERDLMAREALIIERETKLTAVVAQKDEELASLRALLATAETTLQQRVRAAVARRDEELRAMVLKQEEEVAARMARREEEIMEAVKRREEDVARMWAEWERQTREGMGRAVEERMEWVQQRAEELEAERARLDGVRKELETKMKALEAGTAPGVSERRTRSKNPLEEVKNIMAPLSRLANSPEPVKVAAPPALQKMPAFETPMPTKRADLLLLPGTGAGADGVEPPPSAMKGVILTATGEPVATPSPAELAKLFVDTPRVGLNFAKIFDFDTEDEEEDGGSGSEGEGGLDEDGYETDTRPRPASREKRREREKESDGESTPTQSTTNNNASTSTSAAPAVRPTRLRRPSIRASSASAAYRPAAVATDAASSGSGRTRITRASSTSSVPSSTGTVAALAQAPPPQYDFADVENLPSPFLKKVEDRVPAGSSSGASAATSSTTTTRQRNAPRKSGATLRAIAAVNAAKASTRPPSSGSTASASVRSSIVKAQRANEEARKALGVRS